jgi:uncharacterized membrane protein
MLADKHLYEYVPVSVLGFVSGLDTAFSVNGTTFIKKIKIGWLRRTILSIGGAGWLFFLPNASYLITEFVHILLIPLVAALTGLFLFSASLNIAHSLLKRSCGSLQAWSLVLLVLLLSSFGVYIGRFIRWNSWDVLLRPGTLAKDILSLWADPELLAHMLPFTVFVFIITGLFYLSVLHFSSMQKANSL